MKRYIVSLAILLIAGFAFVQAATIKIAASLPDLGSIASYIGGNRVEVFSIAKSNANVHYVEVLPSYMIKISRANIYLKVGLALDQWSNEIIDGSRNNKLIVVDCSQGISVLEKPTAAGTELNALGDVHPLGNPHYWLDPSNGIVIARNVLQVLKKTDPSNSAYFEKNYENFKEDAEKRISIWKSEMAKNTGRKIISYHSSWAYLASAFGLIIAGYVEPLPGIPPTGKHLAELINIIKNNNAGILLQEPYFPDDAPNFLSRQTGIRVLKFAPSCSDVKPDSYFRHFDEIINQITGR